MCWVGRCDVKIAKRDFYVYKVGRVSDKGFNSLYQNFIYIPGVLNEKVKIRPIIYNYSIHKLLEEQYGVIYEGYHSYKDITIPYSGLRSYYRTIYLGKIAEDILSCDEDSFTRHTTLILHKDENITESIVSLIRHKKLVETNVPIDNFLLSRLYPAREDEKKELFDALAKRGKAWDSEKKQIVDLKPKCEFKPFDKVVVRCSKADKWSIDFFSYKVSNGYICTGDAWFGYCLPYNEETAKLVGTTNNVGG